MISIIDYGIGNLRSVQKALEYLKIKAVITSDEKVILRSDAIILPGVGAFPDAMKNISDNGIDKTLAIALTEGKPILGICLGMQLLFEESDEIIRTQGLGFIKGKVKKLEGNIKVPHMGWNSINIKKNCPLLKGVEEGSFAYFVHSYYVQVEKEEDLNATTFYGSEITAVVSANNVYGVQFHPEKSGDAGMKILQNFGELVL
ncbi:MAG TPA: imidazole glycerol phosphate synthase subunit HisH [Clostridiaceae bacterium]